VVGIVINPGAFTHTSIAIHDALKAFAGPIIEVHLSYVSLVAGGVICGLGAQGYALAIEAMAHWLAPASP
jgi:3-dehydroquinate dehydratase-2